MSCQKESGRPAMSHSFLLVAAAAAACFVQSAMAGCPPGYLPKAGNCIPGPAQPHHPPVSVATPRAPVAVLPADASKPHSLNTQPVPAGKVALNPQPIPPGQILRKSPSPPAPAPVDQTPHWDLKKNKGS